MGKKTCVVDFDGTIVEHDFPRIGKLKPGVIEALTKLQKKYRIVISSCRNNAWLNQGDDTYHQEMKAFLVKHKVPHDDVDEGKCGKYVAHVYIDDRAIRFEDNWQDIADLLTESAAFQ